MRTLILYNVSIELIVLFNVFVEIA